MININIDADKIINALVGDKEFDEFNTIDKIKYAKNLVNKLTTSTDAYYKELLMSHTSSFEELEETITVETYDLINKYFYSGKIDQEAINLIIATILNIHVEDWDRYFHIDKFNDMVMNYCDTHCREMKKTIIDVYFEKKHKSIVNMYSYHPKDRGNIPSLEDVKSIYKIHNLFNIHNKGLNHNMGHFNEYSMKSNKTMPFFDNEYDTHVNEDGFHYSLNFSHRNEYLYKYDYIFNYEINITINNVNNIIKHESECYKNEKRYR